MRRRRVFGERVLGNQQFACALPGHSACAAAHSEAGARLLAEQRAAASVALLARHHPRTHRPEPRLVRDGLQRQSAGCLPARGTPQVQPDRLRPALDPVADREGGPVAARGHVREGRRLHRLRPLGAHPAQRGGPCTRAAAAANVPRRQPLAGLHGLRAPQPTLPPSNPAQHRPPRPRLDEHLRARAGHVPRRGGGGAAWRTRDPRLGGTRELRREDAASRGRAGGRRGGGHVEGVASVPHGDLPRHRPRVRSAVAAVEALQEGRVCSQRGAPLDAERIPAAGHFSAGRRAAILRPRRRPRAAVAVVRPEQGARRRGPGQGVCAGVADDAPLLAGGARARRRPRRAPPRVRRVGRIPRGGIPPRAARGGAALRALQALGPVGGGRPAGDRQRDAVCPCDGRPRGDRLHAARGRAVTGAGAAHPRPPEPARLVGDERQPPSRAPPASRHRLPQLRAVRPRAARPEGAALAAAPLPVLAAGDAGRAGGEAARRLARAARAARSAPPPRMGGLPL
mmetsp:Transcript_25574/g.81852  ORF Transcript_25574/g.81852 Transcript_25574/m.81852 type:complete len:512 (+) Transcript_25574:192-1727(+)